jgi:hypothetical protein
MISLFRKIARKYSAPAGVDMAIRFAILCKVHARQKVETAKCPSKDEWMSRMWSVHTVEYYWAIKRNEALYML